MVVNVEHPIISDNQEKSGAPPADKSVAIDLKTMTTDKMRKKLHDLMHPPPLLPASVTEEEIKSVENLAQNSPAPSPDIHVSLLSLKKGAPPDGLPGEMACTDEKRTPE